MKRLNDAIDRFCALHRNFGINNLMRYIVIADALVYLMFLLTGSNYRLIELISLNPGRVLHGEIWRLVTFIFVPFSLQPLSLLLSLYFYYWIGNILEQHWGSGKFTFYYISGIVLTVLSTFLLYFFKGYANVAGLHYVNMSMFLAYALLYPDTTVYLFFILPLKVKWLAAFDAVYFGLGVLTSAMYGDWAGAVAPIVALLNFFIFFSPYFSYKTQVAKRQQSRQTVEFRKAIREQQKEKGYNHKCEVCGRTDTDYPDLQFRYCSKCKGYHCYCEDHIYNHTHHTE